MAIPWNARIVGAWRGATAGQILRAAAQMCYAPTGQIDDGPVITDLVCDETLDDLTLRLLLHSPIGSSIGGRDGVLNYQAAS